MSIYGLNESHLKKEINARQLINVHDLIFLTHCLKMLNQVQFAKIRPKRVELDLKFSFCHNQALKNYTI